MDTAPLVLAHAHARKAVSETHKGSTQTAREEHELAAGEFANARSATEDLEAIRILELLQDHHHQIAAAMKAQSTRPKSKSSSAQREGDNKRPSSPTTSTPQDATQAQALPPKSSDSPARPRRTGHRDLSSSIASNLARQRRGLPATPELSIQQAPGKILSQIDRPGYNSTRQLSPDRARKPQKPPAAPESVPTPVTSTRRMLDVSFSKFYNSYDSVFSKLTAPLAFAGLPLTAEQAVADETQPQTKREKTRASATDDPDLTKLISSAALRAIREDAGAAFGPQESFYLVPPTGGTESYAGILSGGRHNDGPSHQRNAAHVPETIDEDADEFVDARENFGPPSPRSLRSSRNGKADSPTASRSGGRKSSLSGKTVEELEVINAELKRQLDKQVKRVQMWEMSSQSQSMALQQSIRAARPPPALSATNSDPTATERALPMDAAVPPEHDRIKELEEQIKAERLERENIERKAEKLTRDNESMNRTIGKYRNKWEELKAGARKRESDKKSTSTGLETSSAKPTETGS